MRSAAIEYPYGRPVGQVGDREGQRKVLLEALKMFEGAKKPVRAGEDFAAVAKEVSDGARFDVYVFHDASGRERVIGELERARADFQRLLDAAPDGIVVIGRGRLLYANPVLLRWVGYSDVAALRARACPR